MLARYHSMEKLPKELRAQITLRPEDEALMFDKNTHGEPVRGGNTIDLGNRKVRKGMQAILFYSGNVFPIPIAFQHRQHSTARVLAGVLHLDVSVKRAEPSLIRERIVSNFPGTNEIDVIVIGELIHLKMGGEWEHIFAEVDESNIRDANTNKVLRQRVSSRVGSILANYGFQLHSVRVEVGETHLERQVAMKAVHKEQLEARRQAARLEQESSQVKAETEAMRDANRILKKKRKKLAKMEAQYMQRQMEARMRAATEESETELAIMQSKRNEELNRLHNKTLSEDEKIRAIDALEIKFVNDKMHRRSLRAAELERMQVNQQAITDILDTQQKELELKLQSEEINKQKELTEQLRLDNEEMKIALRVKGSEADVMEAENTSLIKDKELELKQKEMDFAMGLFKDVQERKEKRIESEKKAEIDRIEMEESRMDKAHERQKDMNKQVMEDRQGKRDLLDSKLGTVESENAADFVSALFAGREEKLDTDPPQVDRVESFSNAADSINTCPTCGNPMEADWKFCPICSGD